MDDGQTLKGLVLPNLASPSLLPYGILITIPLSSKETTMKTLFLDFAQNPRFFGDYRVKGLNKEGHKF